MNLDKEEQDLLESFERGEWVTVPDFEAQKAEFEAMAAAALARDHKVEIPLSERDYLDYRRKANEEGLSFEEYLSSILHKFITGTLA